MGVSLMNLAQVEMARCDVVHLRQQTDNEILTLDKYVCVLLEGH